MTREELEIKRKELHAKQFHLKGKVGDRYETTDGLFCTVVDVVRRKRFVIFDDGFETSTNLANLQRGICKNRQFHKVWGVGICEKGKHIAQVDGKGTKLYDHWTAMLNRCYNPNSSKYNADRYLDVTVDERFHYFQDFAEWCINQVGHNEDFVLDKDLLSDGQRAYSPEHCVFVPNEINAAFNSAQKARGQWPIGVYYNKKACKFIAQINEFGTRRCLGRFSTPDDAFNVYKINKEKQLKELADLWKGKIDSRVLYILRNHEVKITD